eukprot:9654741-Alexandrium_andersonii.AAC.1
MSASLVGSEMCIRDRRAAERSFLQLWAIVYSPVCCLALSATAFCSFLPVSYTHLTLPTICSV